MTTTTNRMNVSRQYLIIRLGTFSFSFFPAIVTVTENNIDMSDFERVIDPTTGREILRMKADILKAKGLEGLANAEFEIIVDATTGQSRIIMKTPSSDLSGGRNTNFEIVVDYVTGKQKIIKRTTTERESGNDETLFSPGASLSRKLRS